MLKFEWPKVWGGILNIHTSKRDLEDMRLTCNRGVGKVTKIRDDLLSQNWATPSYPHVFACRPARINKFTKLQHCTAVATQLVAALAVSKYS